MVVDWKDNIKGVNIVRSDAQVIKVEQISEDIQELIVRVNSKWTDSKIKKFSHGAIRLIQGGEGNE